jgi:hypothetical protein
MTEMQHTCGGTAKLDVFMRVTPRKIPGVETKPEVLAIVGRVFLFRALWVIEDGLYVGETAWMTDDPEYPEDAPIWIASGDLQPVKKET